MPEQRTIRRIENRLLANLSLEEREKLTPYIVNVQLEVGQILGRPGEPIKYVYFPHSGLVSLVSTMQDGRVIETATIGLEGFVGLEGLLAGNTFASEAVVQIAGTGVRVEFARLKEAAQASARLREHLFRYARAFLLQVAQSVACNSFHTIEERCCRWLLMAQDRTGQDELGLTHEFLAVMLGVRRSSVSLVARTLQNAGLIRYRRGIITIDNREGLEEAACECYATVRRAFERIVAHRSPREQQP
jgi:CRP-like cAMP-binding protein